MTDMPDPTPADRKSTTVRQRILDAALAILHDAGVKRLTQVAVAERAGVRQSHLTYYFPTRDTLLEAVTAEAVSALACEVRGAVTESGTDGDRWLERLAASVAELEHMRMFVAMAVEADGDATIRALMVTATRRMEAVVAEAIGGAEATIGLDSTERARLVLAAVWGLGLYQFVMRPEDDSGAIGPYVSWLRTSLIL